MNIFLSSCERWQTQTAEVLRQQRQRKRRGFRQSPRAVRTFAGVPCFPHGYAALAQFPIAGPSPLLPDIAA